MNWSYSCALNMRKLLVCWNTIEYKQIPVAG